MYKLTFLFVIALTLQINRADDHYKAAVVEISPKLDGGTPSDIIIDNARQYTEFIREAAQKRAKIIVFPEDGLQGWNMINPSNLDELSTKLPKPEDKVVPAAAHSNEYSQPLIDLSNAAKSNNIYVVVNLIEKVAANKNTKPIYYNTNIAIDNKGAIVAKYQKINLYGESHFASGDKSQTSIFTTDFGVTFGMFICFDIVFENPSMNILKNAGVTDIVYPNAWFSVLPFYSALSIHHGYAVSNGVNLLSAGMNNPNETNGGSGIFLANGRIGKTYVTGFHKSKLLLEDVPIIKTRTPEASCDNAVSPLHRDAYQGVHRDALKDFVTLAFDKSEYTHKKVDLAAGEISDKVCSGKYCCSFEISVDKNFDKNMNYQYQLVAFHGSESVSTDNHNIGMGIRVCGLVTCVNDSVASCGIREGINPSVTFNKISVTATTSSKYGHDQPSTLNFDLQPLIGYKYCSKKLNGNEVEISVSTTESQNSVMTFGILGRVYVNDHKPSGLIEVNSASSSVISYFNVLVLSIIVFFLQE